MLYHIKFLKVPTATKEGYKSVLSLSNDLGDALFHGSAEIGIEVGKRRSKVTWSPGDRSVTVITAPGPIFRATVLSSRDDLFPDQPARFLDLYAQAVNGKFPAKSIRKFDSIPLTIKEDTGNSIARHVWDAGVTLAHTLTKERIYEQITGKDSSQQVGILELGAGCGIVGLAVEKHLGGQGSLILSDLEEARECAEESIALNNSSASFMALDWADEDVSQLTNLDLIIVADCTYNMDMYETLVACLERLLKANPSAKVVIGHKMRNEQESEFFEMLEQRLKVERDSTESVGVQVRVVVAKMKE
ncbi:putative methyltransferase-domain-containing protein, partial [Yarrowia lipolytica]|jgi:predicted nicotinamide N-methyase|uniref:YALI0C07865p n=2 Tax=Yarrowia lipolytica TaxID=4952 RepID=Q6CCN8_YARLI|eukprot:XP_501574.1 YALI0C07865p [Yarrowia lipolytica CLIB122]